MSDVFDKREVIITSPTANTGEQMHTRIKSNEVGNGIINYWNVDSATGNPTSWFIPNEVQQISPTHNAIQLIQIPDDTMGIKMIDEDDNTLHEVYSETDLQNDVNGFFVYWGNGIVRFHASKAGKQIITSYYGKGVMMISTARIFHPNEKSGAVSDTLQNILERAEDGLKLVESAGGLVEAINTIDKKVQAGNIVIDGINTAIEEAQMFGVMVDFTRQTFVLKQNETGVVSASEIATVYSKMLAYKGGQVIKPTIVSDNGIIVGNGCTLRVSEDNEITLVSIDQSQSVTQASCTVQIQIRKEDLFVGNGEGTDITIEKEFTFSKISDGHELYDFQITPSMYSFSSNYEGYVFEEQEIECELIVTKANVPCTITGVSIAIPSNATEAIRGAVISNNRIKFTAVQSDSLPDNGVCGVTITAEGRTFTKMFTYAKVKEGASSKSIYVTGEQIFRYSQSDYSGVPDIITTTLTALTQNLTGTTTLNWTYKNDLGYYSVMPSDVLVNGNQCTIRHNSAIWGDRKSVTVKCDALGNEIFDEITLIKITSGATGADAFYVHLSNETHSVTMDNQGTIIDNVDNVFTDVEAYLGTMDVTGDIDIEITEMHECNAVVEDTITGSKRILLKSAYLDEGTGGAPDEADRNCLRFEDATCISTEADESVHLELELGEKTPAMSSNDTSWVKFNVNYKGYTVSKVFTIAKVIQGANGNQGEQGDSFILNVLDGTRSVSYDQISSNPRPPVSQTFIAELYRNGEIVNANDVQFTWNAQGHVYGSGLGNAFTPSIRDTFDESMRVNELKVTAVYQSKETIVTYIPLSVTRDASGLDWIRDWDKTKTYIGDTMVLTPKLFAGTKDAQERPTGVAIGTEALNNESFIGVVGYQNGKASFVLDTKGALGVGQILQNPVNGVGMTYDNGKFRLNVTEMSIQGIKVPDNNEINNSISGAIQGVKDEFGKDIGELQGLISNLEKEIGDSIADGVFNGAEKAKVEATLLSLEVEYEAVLTQVDKLLLNPSLEDQAVKSLLQNRFTTYKASFTDLKASVQAILNIGVDVRIPSELLANFTNRYNTFNTATADIHKSVEDALLSINQSYANAIVETAKQEVIQEISDVSNSLDDFQDYVNGEFESGLISQAKTKAILEHIKIITNELADITSQYEMIVNSEYLLAGKKTELAKLKGNLDFAHTTLISNINSAIVDYVFTEAELVKVNGDIDAYTEALKRYSAYAQECNVDIAKNVSQSTVDAITDEEVFNKVTSHGIKQGMFIDNGDLYINGQYIYTRNFVAGRDDGTETFKIDKDGEVHINATSFYLVGSDTNIPTKDEVQDAIDGVSAGSMNIILSNESQIIPTDPYRNPLQTQTFTTNVTLFKGTTQVTEFTIGAITSANGITATVNNTNKTISFSVSTDRVLTANNGSFGVSVSAQGVTINKRWVWACGKQGIDGDNAITVVLDREATVFPTSSSGNIASAITTTANITAYKGGTAITPTLGSLPSVTGLELTKSGSTVTIKALAGSSLADSGSFNIPIVADGKNFVKAFSWSKSKQGATGNQGASGSNGTDAKVVTITASSQIFKSTNGSVYAPSAITLTPTFQSVSYSKWMYSQDGGKTWKDVASGSAGLTIANGVLTVANNSSLFTSSITSLVFKVFTNVANTTDSMTIARITDGQDGQDGQGIVSITEQYYLSTSMTSLVGGSWGTNVPTASRGRYIWTRSLISYTDSTSTTTTAVCVSGADGVDGDDGVSITSVDAEYAKSSSSTTAPTSGWSTTSPTWTNGSYIWSRTKTSYSSGSPTYTNPVCITGAKGETGSAGVNAKTVHITSSSQIFKSTDGGITFSPDTIKLTPQLTECTFSNWRYSDDGGNTWLDASGANGVTISSGVLTLSKNSTLFSATKTAISFRLNTNVSTLYDVVTIVRIYDVTDLKFGGRNYIRNSGSFTNLRHWVVNDSTASMDLADKDGYSCIEAVGSITNTATIPIEPSTTYIYSAEILFSENTAIGTTTPIHYWMRKSSNGISMTDGVASSTRVSGGGSIPANTWTRVVIRLTTTSDVTATGYFKAFIYGSMLTATNKYWLKNIQFEKANHVSDWNKNPDDATEVVDVPEPTSVQFTFS